MLLTSGAGASLIEASHSIDIVPDSNTNNLIGLVIQTIIGIITIFKLIKKKKDV
jgi:hypothetical protein